MTIAAPLPHFAQSKRVLMAEAQTPMAEHASGINTLIERWRQGDRDAYDRVFTLLHNDLRNIARRLFARERLNHTLQTDDLVNQFYLKMTAGKTIPWNNYLHFLRGASRTMRQILIDHSRQWGRRPTGKMGAPLPENDSRAPAAVASDEDQKLLRVLQLNQAIEKLNQQEPSMGQIADLHLILGLTMKEIAECSGLSSSKVKRKWSLAKKYILKEVGGSSTP